MNETPKPKLRWYQYSLRTLFVVMVLCAIACSWFVVRMNRARKQEEAVKAIRDVGGDIHYTFQYNRSGKFMPKAEPWAPGWLRSAIGEDFFLRVKNVWIPDGTDAKVERLGQHLRNLTTLGLKQANSLR